MKINSVCWLWSDVALKKIMHSCTYSKKKTTKVFSSECGDPYNQRSKASSAQWISFALPHMCLISKR